MPTSTAKALVAAGVALVVVYSAVMIAAEGASSWAWLLLAGGIAALVVGIRALTGDDDAE